MSAIKLASLNDTARLGETVARHLRIGDVISTAGDLGAGKTTFAQFLVRALSPMPVEVTSPTFTLLQTYPVALADGAACEFYHYDLYRIEHESALVELGLDEALTGVALIEWPERLGGYHLPVSLALSFALQDDGGRTVRLLGGDPRWKDLLA